MKDLELTASFENNRFTETSFASEQIISIKIEDESIMIEIMPDTSDFVKTGTENYNFACVIILKCIKKKSRNKRNT